MKWNKQFTFAIFCNNYNILPFVYANYIDALF